MKDSLGLMIRFYQKLLPARVFFKKFLFLPEHACRFSPACSDYAHQAIKSYGIMRGGLKAVWRIFRCNPLSSGGFDPLERRNK
ncbi:MAG: membrane protein insertion efficiency factor YidD [Patescibacteria group bacterium]|nr:membrane protein insertion efficiency factor YidD [Patescibacteria group bacterium]